jgi:hypothetical protein
MSILSLFPGESNIYVKQVLHGPSDGQDPLALPIQGAETDQAICEINIGHPKSDRLVNERTRSVQEKQERADRQSLKAAGSFDGQQYPKQLCLGENVRSKWRR